MEDIGHTAGHQGRRTTDEYGNPINEGGIGGFSTSGTGTGVTTGYGTGTGTPLSGGGYGHEGQHQHHDGITGMLHRSDSSSSSEDDGLGGRRKKKGITEKIREKLPGGGHRSDQMTSTTTPGSYAYEGGHHGQEKKGMMEKIKDKLPGHNA